MVEFSGKLINPASLINKELLLRTNALTLCQYGFTSSIYYRNR
jgi:hypothetical protein